MLNLRAGIIIVRRVLILYYYDYDYCYYCSRGVEIIIIIIIIIIIALEVLKLQALRMRRHRLDALFLTQVYFGFKISPSVLELLVSEFLLGISEIFLCSMSAPHVKIVPLLDVHQLLMLSEGR
jgi:hypothetical protein